MASMLCFRNVLNRISPVIVRSTCRQQQQHQQQLQQRIIIPQEISATSANYLQIQRRLVGTSDSTQKSSTNVEACPSPTATTSSEEKPKMKYWVSYGFSHVDPELDNHLMHLSFFVVISIVFCGGAYLLAYMPDFRLKDWAQREAYIQLRERENAGLPPISPDLVDPSKFQLPSDEELGDFEIII